MMVLHHMYLIIMTLSKPLAAGGAYLNFNLVERFSVVYTNYAADHLWKNDHIPQMRLHNLWFLQLGGLLFRFSQSSHKIDWFPFKSPRKPSPGTGVNQFHKLIMR